VTHEQDTRQAAGGGTHPPHPPTAEPAEPQGTTDGVHEADAPDAEEPELAAAREMAAESEAAEAPAGGGPSAEPATGEPEPDYKDKWLRAVAELDNIRKRARRDVATAESRGIAKLARELLSALDSFERALAAAESQPENRDHHLTDGIRLVQTELLGALGRVGIEADSPKGQRFDPHRHEAVAQQPADGAEPGTIVEVYSAGYTYGDDVLRPAKVVVAG
jgi:molecular chaperone GrpE